MLYGHVSYIYAFQKKINLAEHFAQRNNYTCSMADPAVTYFSTFDLMRLINATEI